VEPALPCYTLGSMRNIQKKLAESEIIAKIRKRNQITLPIEAIEALGLREGDTVVIKLKNGSATLRPVRRSYAGIAKGLYEGDFLKRERASWE
jgi:AbrB family looped-hinge helix DNA binding protein